MESDRDIQHHLLVQQREEHLWLSKGKGVIAPTSNFHTSILDAAQIKKYGGNSICKMSR
jgi:hypothetical protein